MHERRRKARHTWRHEFLQFLGHEDALLCLVVLRMAQMVRVVAHMVALQACGQTPPARRWSQTEQLYSSPFWPSEGRDRLLAASFFQPLQARPGKDEGLQTGFGKISLQPDLLAQEEEDFSVSVCG